MSLVVTLAADALVAVLLVATIATSVRLSRRIARLKADEAGMRQTIGDLVVVTTTAERAITGLRAALDECDRTLAARLDAAECCSADLAVHVEAGEGVIERISAIVAQNRPVRSEKPRAAQPVQIEPTRPTPDETTSTVTLSSQVVSNSDRLGAALAAAQVISERALDRIRARAA